MNILIAVPAYPGIIKSDCVVSLMGAQRALLKRGLDVDMAKNEPTDVVLARNIFASFIINTNKFTHILFVDNDMAFEPSAVLRLIDAKKAVIGHIYPKKTTKPAFVVRMIPGHKELTIRDGMCAVAGLGMGLCLIEKAALQIMVASQKLRVSVNHGKEFKIGGPLYGFFDPVPDPADNGDLMPEDFSFCERWRSHCGGEVFGIADEEILHIGEITYRGKFLDHLKSQSPKP